MFGQGPSMEKQKDFQERIAHLTIIRSLSFPARLDFSKRNTLPIVGITDYKMNCLEFSLIVFTLASHAASFGRCDDVASSICWMGKDDALERQNGNIWLNDTSLKSIGQVGKVTFLMVSPAVENKLTLQYGGSVQTWTFRISRRKKLTEIRGWQKPSKEPTNDTKSFLDLMGSTEVFACEIGTLFFHQDEHFFLAFGHTKRRSVQLESRTPSALLLSWVRIHPDVSNSHTVTLYHAELDSYSPLSTDTTSNNHYSFTALDSCSPYVACVEIAGTHSFTCLSAVTDPDIPKDFEVMSWNSSSISLAWDCPENCKFSLFLLTAFYLNGTDHVTEEVRLWHREDSFVVTLSDLEPCRRVTFGLQTVCQEGMAPRYSAMVLNDGNLVHSNIEALRQASYGPDNYTLSWEVQKASSISMFRVYHEGVLQGATLVTDYAVAGLLPCRQYHARVEALCGDGVLTSAGTVTAHTGPRGVSELRYRPKDSTALWIPGTEHGRAVAVFYELALENGTAVQSGRASDAELHLPELEGGKTYVLSVWEECDGQWQSERSSLFLEGAKSSSELHVRAAGSARDPELQIDTSSTGLTMVLPWSLPAGLQDDVSEPRAKMRNISEEKLQELLEDFEQPATFAPAAGKPNQTEVLFVSFDASLGEGDAPLPVGDQLDHIRSLNKTDITVTDGVIRWDGPDLCASSAQTLCPRNSLCVNTVGSYVCVCQQGYYDVSSVVKPPAASLPVCNEKGLFIQCLDRLVTGGVAKPYLTSHVGGEVGVRLNDGRCAADESEVFFSFLTSRNASECGAERRVNETHIEFQNTLTVTLTRGQTVKGRDLKVVWKCVYSRHYAVDARVGVDTEGLSSFSLVEFTSALQLGLTMALYADDSYAHSYWGATALGREDTLFFQVALQTNGTFASDVRLRVESCWATEGADPWEAAQGVLLRDGCPVDDTFRWLSVNGLAQKSRFSVQMFTMPQGLPLYVHCLANICGPDEDCVKSCSSQQRPKRSASREDRRGERAAVLSAGPLLVSRRVRSGAPPSHWAEHMTIIIITMLSVSATKAMMAYCEQLQLQ